MGLGLNCRVSIVVGTLIGKVATNQIANLAGYQLSRPLVVFLQQKPKLAVQHHKQLVHSTTKNSLVVVLC